jgi:hypothetical protein
MSQMLIASGAAQVSRDFLLISGDYVQRFVHLHHFDFAEFDISVEYSQVAHRAVGLDLFYRVAHRLLPANSQQPNA